MTFPAPPSLPAPAAQPQPSLPPIRAQREREAGFTLTELMIVLVVIGILAIMAIPKFMNVATDAKMTEAKMMLKQVAALQQAYYYERDRYADALGDLGFEQSVLQSEGGTARYLIRIERADATGYVATATSTVDFNRNGVFNVWEVDDAGVIRQRVPD